MIIGLTGGIASGKSTVSTMIKDLGIPVIDADVIAREVVEKGEEAYQEIVAFFGPDILTDEGYLDRKKLGSIVFNNEKKRLVLNDIVHPAIRKRMLQKVDEFKEKGNKVIVLDIPLLFESKLTYMVEKIILVYVDQDVQRERLKKRDQFSEAEIDARIKAQMPLKEKINLSDELINNNVSIIDTNKQLISILKKWNCI